MYIIRPDWVSHPDDRGRQQPIYSIHIQPVHVADAGTDASSSSQSQAASLKRGHSGDDASESKSVGPRIATGGQDGRIRLWNSLPILDPDAEMDESVPRLLSILAIHTGAVLCVRWSSIDGRLLASGSDDSKIVIWDKDRSGQPSVVFGETTVPSIETWRAIKVLFGHESDVAQLAWAPDNAYLASCGLDSHVIIWDGRSF
ncbi:HIR complex subunit, partial [Cladochytrium tenue]